MLLADSVDNACMIEYVRDRWMSEFKVVFAQGSALVLVRVPACSAEGPGFYPQSGNNLLANLHEHHPSWMSFG